MLSIFLENNLPFDLNLLPHNTCLVGGAVRDVLIKREREYLDLDFVLPQNAIQIAKKIANEYHAGFVVLDSARQIARVVFSDASIDFAQQEGKTLTEDLQRRDFTINAIAYNPYTDELIDPLEGKKDLEQGIIRMISEVNLKDDPLRLLRAYRQASQLNFTIESNTRLTIQKLAPLLTQVAPERIRTELGYLLTTETGSQWLVEAYDDGLLSVWLKNATAEKVKRLVKIDKVGNQWQQNWTELVFKSYLAKLAALLSENPEVAKEEVKSLKYSRAEIRTVTTIVKYLPEILEQTIDISLRKQYFFFIAAGEVFPLIAVSAMALGGNQKLISNLINRYLNPNDQIAHPQPLLTGNDLINHLNLAPSPKIGELLTEIHIAYIEGKVTNTDDALNFATSLILKACN